MLLDLSGNHLVGTLNNEPSLCNLSRLQVLDLSDNLLSSELPGISSDDCMPALQALNLEGNTSHLGLSGQLPIWVLVRAFALNGLFALRLQHNSFETPGRHSLLALINVCHTGRSGKPPMQCSGLPPNSCSAFGPTRHVVSVYGETCVECDGNHVATVLALAGLLAAGILVLIMLYRLSRGSPGIVRRYFASIIIIAQHAQVPVMSLLRSRVFTQDLKKGLLLMPPQVLAVLGSMDLNWPPLLTKIFDLLQFQLLSLPWIRAECLVEPTTLVVWMLAYAQGMATCLILLFLICAGRRFEKVLFCVFAMLFTTILRSSFTLAVKMGLTRANDVGFYTIGILISNALLLTTVYLLRFFWQLVSADNIIAIRFAKGKGSWQFVIWYRQLALFGISASLELCHWYVS